MENFNFSFGSEPKGFQKNTPYKRFQQHMLHGFRKELFLKHFKQGHCQNFAGNMELIGLETPERQSLQLIMPAQFPESGLDVLPLMIKSVQFGRRQVQVGGNTIKICPHGPFAGSAIFLPTDPADDHDPGFKAGSDHDFSHIQDRNSF